MKKIVGFLVVVLAILGIIKGLTADNGEPISAKGMSEEERMKIDVGVLMEETKDLGVEEIRINYSRDAIKIYISKKSTEQYVSDEASEIKELVWNTIIYERGKLTLEKEDYSIYVYGKDGRLIY